MTCTHAHIYYSMQTLQDDEDPTFDLSKVQKKYLDVGPHFRDKAGDLLVFTGAGQLFHKKLIQGNSHEAWRPS